MFGFNPKFVTGFRTKPYPFFSRVDFSCLTNSVALNLSLQMLQIRRSSIQRTTDPRCTWQWQVLYNLMPLPWWFIFTQPLVNSTLNNHHDELNNHATSNNGAWTTPQETNGQPATGGFMDDDWGDDWSDDDDISPDPVILILIEWSG